MSRTLAIQFRVGEMMSPSRSDVPFLTATQKGTQKVTAVGAELPCFAFRR